MSFVAKFLVVCGVLLLLMFGSVFVAGNVRTTTCGYVVRVQVASDLSSTPQLWLQNGTMLYGDWVGAVSAHQHICVVEDGVGNFISMRNTK